MLMVIRFFLGAVAVMNYEHKPNESLDTSSPHASTIEDGIGLLSGLVHFVIFFAWASTLGIDPAARGYLKLSLFEILLLLVLLYDVVWWVASIGHHFRKLNQWTTINVATFIVCLLVHLLTSQFTERWRVTECMVFIPVMVISMIDVSEIISQRELILPWFRQAWNMDA